MRIKFRQPLVVLIILVCLCFGFSFGFKNQLLPQFQILAVNYDDGNNDKEENCQQENPSENCNSSSTPTSSLIALGIGGYRQVLGATDNYNPIIFGIRQSYGSVLGVSSLPLTGNAPVSENKSPSGNIRKNGVYFSIPKFNFQSVIYQAQKVGDEWIIGDREVIESEVNGGYFIYGHNSADVFGSIRKLSIGDTFIRSEFGQEKIFTINSISRVGAKYGQIAENIKPNTITLVSCDVFDPTLRVVIKAITN